MQPAFDVIVFGDYFCDLIFTGLPHMPAPGEEVYSRAFDVQPGGSFNSACAMHRLRLKVGWACDFGNDLFSQFALEAARREGLEDSLFRVHPRPIRRVTASASFPEDRAFLSFADPEPAFSAGLRAVVKARARVAYLPGLLWGEFFQLTVPYLKSLGTKVVMDGNSQSETLDNLRVRAAIGQVDVFCPNAAEARVLTRTDSVGDALKVLGALCPLVVVKDGAEGAYAMREGRVVHSPALPVTPVDTTGAGDCFNAGFLAAWLEGKRLEECLRWGNIAGGLSTTACGGAAAAPRLEELKLWL